MKKRYALSILLFAGLTTAQADSRLAEAEAFLDSIEKTVNCMSNLDQNYYQQLEKQIEENLQEIQTLCAAGQRNAAEKALARQSKSIMADPRYKEFERCNNLNAEFFDDSLEEEVHICDDL